MGMEKRAPRQEWDGAPASLFGDIRQGRSVNELGGERLSREVEAEHPAVELFHVE
jgi:hypothetical protein